MANTYDVTQKLQAIADAISYGGGTTVIANPSGTPTDTLNTIQIASTIYDIAGGGGQGFTLTNLFTEQGTPALNTKTLSDSVLNYDAIYVEGMFNGEALMGNILLKETFENKLGNLYIGLVNFPNAYIGLTLASTATSFATYGGGGANGITRIEGITFGSGGGGGASSADNVSYDNTQSGLTATNVQDAIDENADNISTLNSNITGVSSSITGYNTSYIDGVSITCIEICNNLVILSGAFKPKASNIPNGTQIITGIPKVDVAVFGSAVNANGNAYKIVANAGNTYIQKDEAQTPTNAWYNFMLVYIKATN